MILLNIEGVNRYKVRHIKGHYMTQNKHNRLTNFNSHEEIFLFRKQSTPEMKAVLNFKDTTAALHSGCERQLICLIYQQQLHGLVDNMGLGSCCVFKGISDFPHCHFCLNLIYLTVAVHAAELIPFILCVN